jgi:hypothetical protein
MVAIPRSQRLIRPVAPLVAGTIGLLTAIMFLAVPTDLLESMVIDSGVASVFSAAEPPLGFTARLALVLLCGGGVGVVAWFALFLLFGTRTIVLARDGGSPAAPMLRRADAHPDAPPRRPLFANTDLGTPFLEVRAKPVHVDAEIVAAEPVTLTSKFEIPAEQPLPIDLDQPLSAFDPAAVPDAPADWFPPPMQLKPPQSPTAPIRRQTFDERERFETFPLTPMVRPAAKPATPSRANDPSETIHALLDRLERVAGRRESTPPPETIEDTLSDLRRMATRGR